MKITFKINLSELNIFINMKSKCTWIQSGSFEEYLLFWEYGDEYCQNSPSSRDFIV